MMILGESVMILGESVRHQICKKAEKERERLFGWFFFQFLSFAKMIGVVWKSWF